MYTVVHILPTHPYTHMPGDFLFLGGGLPSLLIPDSHAGRLLGFPVLISDSHAGRFLGFPVLITRAADPRVLPVED